MPMAEWLTGGFALNTESGYLATSSFNLALTIHSGLYIGEPFTFIASLGF